MEKSELENGPVAIRVTPELLRAVEIVEYQLGLVKQMLLANVQATNMPPARPQSLEEFRSHKGLVEAAVIHQDGKTEVKKRGRPRKDSLPVFDGYNSASSTVKDFVSRGDRNWRVGELVEFLTERTNLTDFVTDPKSTVYQAMSRAVRDGLLRKVGIGVYGPLDGHSYDGHLDGNSQETVAKKPRGRPRRS